MIDKPRLVVFSPMPPQKNGIADYWFELLPQMQEHYDITVVVENSYPLEADNPVCVIRLSEYLWRWDFFAGDLHMYQLGNNAGHVYMLPVLLQRPGVVVLHDLTLHHLVDVATLRWGDFDTYCQAVAAEYGRAGAVLSEQFRRTHLRETAMFYELPMTRLIASRSLAVIVHSAYGQVKVLAQEPDALVVTTPHHVSPKVDAILRTLPADQARKQLGYAPQELLLVSLGFITKAKQVDKVLQALARIRSQLPPFRYVLAGHCDPYEYDVHAEIRRHGLDDVVEVTGYLSEDDFFVYARAADMIINLRYPSGGETSGTLIRGLGLGACVVVAEVGPFAELPADTCVKVPWDEDFVNAIGRTLLHYGRDPRARAELGGRARSYAESEHSIAGSVNQYGAVLRQASSRRALPWVPKRPVLFPSVAEQRRIVDRLPRAADLPLWLREGLVPLPTDVESQVVTVSARSQLREMLASLGYSAERITAASIDDLAASGARRETDLVLLDEAEVLDVRDVLPAVNRRLRMGGCVVASISVAAGMQLEEVVAPVEQALAAYGFEVLKTRLLPAQTPLRPDAVRGTGDAVSPSWCAVKISEFPRA